MRAPGLLRDERRRHGKEDGGDGDDGRPRLRLVVARGKLGIELDRPFTLGPLVVRALELSLPDVRFPVDLSGGIDAFRHRRGVLERLEVAFEGSGAPWAADLSACFGGTRPDLFLAPNEDGWLVGLRAGAAALAFELAVVAADEDLRLVPFEARGVALGLPPAALALTVLGAVCRPFGRVVGGAVVVERAARALVMELLPLAGVRAPATEGVRWSAPSPEVGALAIRADSSIGAAPTPRAIRAAEGAALAAEGDEAILSGDADEARRRYISTLERAPRHPELVRRVAELDRSAGRYDVGLGVLRDLGPSADADLLEGELLLALGHRDLAANALERAAESEPFGPLASLAWSRLAEAVDGVGRIVALDRAVARSPSFPELRWQRFEARLVAGDLRGALADAGDLEASERGSESRHRLARRVAEVLLRERHLDAAVSWFERALRYRPDSPEVIAGLARALATVGEVRRALELHLRAVAVERRHATRAGRAPSPAIVLDFARALVEHADDRPAAIAHVRGISASLPESFAARFFEGRWLADLGDTAAASAAFARLADEVERASGALVEPSLARRVEGDARLRARGDLARLVATYLEEAARIEELDRGDVLAAKRLLGLALRLEPRRASLSAAFRRVVAEPRRDAPATPAPAAAPTSWSPETSAAHGSAPFDAAEEERRVEELSERLRADPSDASVVRALADALERLCRDHDLLALLSARIEEDAGALREELVIRRRRVLERMRDAARADGRSDEAGLYELLLSRD